MKGKKYLNLLNVVNSYMNVYNFSYQNGEKSYEIDSNKLTITSKNSDITKKVEVLSLIYNIYEELGIDVNININDENLFTYLDYLNVDYEKNTENSITYDDKVLGKLTVNDSILYEVKVDDILSLLKDIDEKTLEVGVLFNSEEEKIKGVCLMQDLRLTGIICDEVKNENDANFVINLNEDDLIKGIIKVKDNALNEEVDVPEDEIIEYMLGVI